MKKITLTTALLFASTIAFADASLEQKTQMHFGGFLGGIINVFGRSATHEGTTSTTFVHGDRKSTVTAGNGQIIDLGEEKVYAVDYERKTYTVKTFAEMRKEFEDAKERAEKQKASDKSAAKNEGPEYDVDIDIKDTGRKLEINGFNTHQVLVTITLREKGKKLEQSGGAVLTSDMWMGPRLAAMREVGDFDRRFAQKLYGKEFGTAEMQQMAVLMATNPAFGKAMKAFADKRSSFEGSPIRTTLTFETVAGTEQHADSQQQSDSPSGMSGAIGGLLGRMKKNRDEKQAASDPNSNRAKLFDSTVDVLKASTSASAADVAIPAGFRQK
jgi:hypothetical protein